MQAGRLRQRVTIQVPTLTQDAYGATKTTWANGQTVWAQVRAVNVSERYVAGAAQEIAEVTHIVTMRYGPTVHPRYRLMYGAIVLDVESSVDPDGRQARLECRCREVVE